MINIQRSKNAFAPIFKAPKSKKVAVRAEHKPVKPSKNSLTALSLFSGGARPRANHFGVSERC